MLPSQQASEAERAQLYIIAVEVAAIGRALALEGISFKHIAQILEQHVGEPDDTWREAVEHCLQQHAAELSEWDRDFLLNLRAYHQPTPRQLEALNSIMSKLHPEPLPPSIEPPPAPRGGPTIH